MTHFDIEFEQFQGFFADGILTNFVARRKKSKKNIFLNNLNNFFLLFFYKFYRYYLGRHHIFFDPNRKSRNRIYAPKGAFLTLLRAVNKPPCQKNNSKIRFLRLQWEAVF
jgi:hypothetical protein